MYYLWEWDETHQVLRRTKDRPPYKNYGSWGAARPGWKSRQAAHAFNERNRLGLIVMKMPELPDHQADLVDYIQKGKENVR